MTSTSKQATYEDFVLYANQLSAYKTKNSVQKQRKYSRRLDNNTNLIIEQLGGLHNIIQLCLTNKNATDIIDKQKFDKLKSLINVDSNSTNDDDDENINFVTKPNLSVNCNSSNYEWYNSCIIICVDIENNLYFKYLAKQFAHFVLHRILLNKWCFTIMTGIIVLIGIFETIDLIFFVYLSKMGASSPIISSLILCLFFLIYTCIIGANIGIVYLILQTFDFWFKMINLIQFSFAFAFWSNYRSQNGEFVPQWYVFMQLFIIWTLCLFVFIIDAIIIPQNVSKYKYFVIIIVVLFATAGCFSIYFWSRCGLVYYYPFGNWRIEETRIDIKALLLSSLINITIFLFKPIGSLLFRHLRRWSRDIMIKGACCRNGIVSRSVMSKTANELHAHAHACDYDYDYDCGYEMYNCELIHKRPKIRWQNLNHINVNVDNILFKGTNIKGNELKVPLLQHQSL